MENNKIQNNKKFNSLLSSSVLISSVLIGGALIYGAGLKSIKEEQLALATNSEKVLEKSENTLEAIVIPDKGYELPVKWGNLGKQLVEAGVIDTQKFEAIYASRGGLSDEDKKLLYSENNGNLVINNKNSGLILNLLWAFGLANKNEILEYGPMTDSRYGGAGGFASTGGWTLSNGDSMNYYSRHSLVILTPEQQNLIERVSKNIYRPCCNNSTYFPDCNHGMAMLGLLELAAAQELNEDTLYRLALIANSYWFPETYLTIAKYFESQGVSWAQVNAKEILGFDYSSGSGYQKLLQKIKPAEIQGGGSCGV